MKRYILDTSVILYDPTAICNFEENEIYIPMVVLEELDEAKRYHDHIGRNARKALRMIESFISKGRQSVNEFGGTLTLISDFDPLASYSYLEKKADNYILGTAVHLQNTLCIENVVLVTKDINMRVKAAAMGIESEDYSNGNIQGPSSIGTVKKVTVSTNILDKIYSVERGILTELEDHIPAENGCYIVSDGSRSVLMRFRNGAYRRIKDNFDLYGIKPRNAEQRFLADVLMDPRIDCVIVNGTAGTGKTLLSLAAGLTIVETGPQDIILITKTIMDAGQSIGFVPGTKEDKMIEWIKPFYDNLELINRKKSAKNIQKLFDSGTIEIEALTYMRGRSLMNRWVIFDEAQNLTKKQVKTVVTRISDTSKLVILGDLQQIDHPYLSKNDNGLAHAMERLSGRGNVAVLNLTKSERGRLAEIAVDRL